MKKILIAILLIAFALPHLTKVKVMIDYKLHQTFIEDVLCINKDNKEILCSGVCYIAKKMQTTSDDQQNQNLPQKHREVPPIHLYAHQIIVIEVQDSDPFQKTVVIPTDDHLLIEPFNHDIFHPPRI